MNKLLLLFMLIPLSLSAQMKTDKYYHLGVGTGISIASHLVLKGDSVNPYKGTLITAPVAVGKEFYDLSKGGRFGYDDIIFTLIIPVLIDTSILIIKKIKKKRSKKDPFEYNPELTLR